MASVHCKVNKTGFLPQRLDISALTLQLSLRANIYFKMNILGYWEESGQCNIKKWKSHFTTWSVRDSLQAVGYGRGKDFKENAAFPRWFSLKKKVGNGVT